jgi:phosphopantetheinyl transferase
MSQSGGSTTWLSISELAAPLERSVAVARSCLGHWLAPPERATLARLSVGKRRRDWLAGRVAAKELVRRRHGISGEDALRRIEIVVQREGPHKGKPSYRIDELPGPFDLSISHSGDRAVAALASTPQECIGIDIEQIEARGESFEALALSSAERELVAQLDREERSVAVTQRWVLKEALSKALGTGLRLRFERVTVHIADGETGREASVRFDAPWLRDSLSPGNVYTRLGRIGGICVASVTIQHTKVSP